jgi:hypothetical protein
VPHLSKKKNMQHGKKCYGCRGERPGTGAVRDPKPNPFQSVTFPTARLSVLPCRWKLQIPPNRPYPSTDSYGFASRKTVIFILTGDSLL